MIIDTANGDRWNSRPCSLDKYLRYNEEKFAKRETKVKKKNRNSSPNVFYVSLKRILEATRVKRMWFVASVI